MRFRKHPRKCVLIFEVKKFSFKSSTKTFQPVCMRKILFKTLIKSMLDEAEWELGEKFYAS